MTMPTTALTTQPKDLTLNKPAKHDESPKLSNLFHKAEAVRENQMKFGERVLELKDIKNLATVRALQPKADMQTENKPKKISKEAETKSKGLTKENTVKRSSVDRNKASGNPLGEKNSNGLAIKKTDVILSKPPMVQVGASQAKSRPSINKVNSNDSGVKVVNASSRTSIENIIGSENNLVSTEETENKLETNLELNSWQDLIDEKSYMKALYWIENNSNFKLAYILSDGSIGIIFNDDNKLVLDSAKENMYYITSAEEDQETINKYKAHQYPQELKQKVLSLEWANKQFNMKGFNTSEFADQEGKTQTNYIKKWLKTKHATLLRFNTMDLQVKFIDGSTILLSADGSKIQYLSQEGQVSHHELDNKGSLKDNDVKKRLIYVMEVLNKVWNKKPEQEVSSNNDSTNNNMVKVR